MSARFTNDRFAMSAITPFSPLPMYDEADDGAFNAPKWRVICPPRPIQPTSRDFSRF